ncbi:ADYC domain-containing protein [Sorangium sp. So ce1099]|uniref:ADYC domain-containing protein n=1 Tax=Sorangium sp. So ce1099 TaxID=3133331 RepID=UPI003F636E78
MPFADLLGRKLNGPRIAVHVHFSLSSIYDAQDRPIANVRLEGGTLVRDAAPLPLESGRGTDLRAEQWTGVKLRGVFDNCTSDETMEFPISARIVTTTMHPDLSGVSEYRVEVQDPRPREPGAEPEFVSLCEGDEPALVVPGTWDESGAHRYENGIFSFACPNTAAAKCVNPWNYHPGYADQNPSISALYDACIRMTTADYCGDGDSATKDGTWIDVWDSAHIEEPGSQEGQHFEAAWWRGGAVCMHHARWPYLLKQECRNQIRTCSSAEEAQKLVPPGTALLFNSSEVRPYVSKCCSGGDRSRMGRASWNRRQE